MALHAQLARHWYSESAVRFGVLMNSFHICRLASSLIHHQSLSTLGTSTRRPSDSTYERLIKSQSSRSSVSGSDPNDVLSSPLRLDKTLRMATSLKVATPADELHAGGRPRENVGRCLLQGGRFARTTCSLYTKPESGSNGIIQFGVRQDDTLNAETIIEAISQPLGVSG